MLSPMREYPLEHSNVHVGLVEAEPPAHEAPAVVVEAVTSMGRHVAASCMLHDCMGSSPAR